MMHPELLHSIPFLRDVEPAPIAELAERFTVREIPRGTVLVEEGRPIDALYIICRGVVHVRRRSGAKEMLLARIGPGGFLGEVNLFSEGNATASVHVMELTEVASIPYATFRQFMERHPVAGYRIVSRLMEEICERLRQTNAKLAGNLFWSPRG
jgi:CRP/FNR family cyclic AMP-dependent transcriptional regulator